MRTKHFLYKWKRYLNSLDFMKYEHKVTDKYEKLKDFIMNDKTPGINILKYTDRFASALSIYFKKRRLAVKLLDRLIKKTYKEIKQIKRTRAI